MRGNRLVLAVGAGLLCALIALLHRLDDGVDLTQHIGPRLLLHYYLRRPIGSPSTHAPLPPHFPLPPSPSPPSTMPEKGTIRSTDEQEPRGMLVPGWLARSRELPESLGSDSPAHARLSQRTLHEPAETAVRRKVTEVLSRTNSSRTIAERRRTTHIAGVPPLPPPLPQRCDSMPELCHTDCFPYLYCLEEALRDTNCQLAPVACSATCSPWAFCRPPPSPPPPQPPSPLPPPNPPSKPPPPPRFPCSAPLLVCPAICSACAYAPPYTP